MPKKINNDHSEEKLKLLIKCIKHLNTNIKLEITKAHGEKEQV